MPKCAECGLLSVRDSFSREVAEALKRDREQGWHHNSSDRATPAELFCRAGSNAFPSLSNNPPVIAEQINRENTCDRFIPYHPGRTAEEHESMILVERIKEENRLSRELERAERQREREEDAERAKREREEDLGRAKTWRAEDISARQDADAAIAARFRWSEIRSWFAVGISLLTAIYMVYKFILEKN
jgi:hypothetical protein